MKCAVLLAVGLLVDLISARCLAEQPPASQESRPASEHHATDKPAGENHHAENRTADNHAEEKPKPDPATRPASSTDHQLKLADGGTLHYTATAGFITLKGDDDKPRANVFTIAYTHADDDDAARRTRPITFVFNGGPGAAAIWLHLGTAGPMRVDLPDDGSIPTPPYQLKENPYTWLSFTDLVFIDPVGTGYSRATDPEKAKEFYNVHGDVESVADVIRLYLTANNRWPSPKFVAGESYGTTRAAQLSRHLHDRYGIDANGIVLISTVLNFQTLDFPPGDVSIFPLWLPSYATIAWYHHKLGADLQQLPVEAVAEKAKAFAEDVYLPALIKGSRLDEAARAKVIDRLSQLTGLKADLVRKMNLMIHPEQFEKYLLGDQQKVIGRMDGRISAFDDQPLEAAPDFDPSLSGYVGVFSNCFNDYVRSGLKFESDLPYEFLSPRVHPWDMGLHEGYLDVSETLRSALNEMPGLQVRVCSGWFDLATPFGATEYTIHHMPLSPEQEKHITHTQYPGGHMLYLNHPSLVKLHDDLSAFYEAALPTTRPDSVAR